METGNLHQEASHSLICKYRQEVSTSNISLYPTKSLPLSRRFQGQAAELKVTE